MQNVKPRTVVEDQHNALKDPPPHLSQKEIAPFADWLVWRLPISPRLELLEVDVKPLGEDGYRVHLMAHNTGWLPTYVTQKALERQVVRDVVCEIKLPEGAAFEAG